MIWQWLSLKKIPAGPGSLSDLKHSQLFTSVGYGAFKVANLRGGKTFYYQDVCMQTTGTLNAITKSWLHISQNPALENGGTLRYGDSGGPKHRG